MLKGPLPEKLTISPPDSQSNSRAKKKFFLKDPNADLFINMSNKIFPLHRSQLQTIPYIQKISKNQKVHLIHQNFDIVYLEKVFGFFYGEKLIIKTYEELEQILIICEYFEIQLIPENIQIYILSKNLGSQIGVFILLQLSFSFNLHQAFKYSFSLLQSEEFEQINYNKFDFLNVDFQLFQIILRRHHRLKNVQKKIKGVDQEIIEEVIKMFCKLHKIIKDIQEKLLMKYFYFEQKDNLKKIKSAQELYSPPKILEKGYSHKYPHKDYMKGLDKLSRKGTISSASVSYAQQAQDQQAKIMNIQESSIQKKKNRKYSEQIDFLKGNQSKIPRKLEKSLQNLYRQMKIQEEQNDSIEGKQQSPLIRIQQIDRYQEQKNSEFFAEKNHNKEKYKIPKNKNHTVEQISQAILNIPLFDHEEKFSADPDQMLGKAEQLLGHYQNAFEMHESNMILVKNRIKKSQIFNDETDRRLSAGPLQVSRRSLGMDGRLTNTVDTFKKYNKKI